MNKSSEEILVSIVENQSILLSTYQKDIEKLREKLSTLESLIQDLVEKGVLSPTLQVLPLKCHKKNCPYGKTEIHHRSCENEPDFKVGQHISFKVTSRHVGVIKEIQKTGKIDTGDGEHEGVQYVIRTHKPVNDDLGNPTLLHYVPDYDVEKLR
jgi:hypothetical protein